jgi:hypothetical protein
VLIVSYIFQVARALISVEKKPHFTFERPQVMKSSLINLDTKLIHPTLVLANTGWAKLSKASSF